MGMFDTISSSKEIYGGPWDQDLQTKSFDALLAHYWIDPAGRLYQIDYSYTYDWVEVPKEERKRPLDMYRTIPNGNHGRVHPVNHWGHVHVIPAHYEATHHGKTLIFERGVVVSIEDDITTPGTLNRADNRRRAS